MHVLPLIYLVLSFLSCISAASVTGNPSAPPVDHIKTARKCFLNNLNQKNTNSAVEPIQALAYSVQADNFSVAGINDTLMRYIFEFLDIEDVDKIKNLSTCLRSCSALALAVKLKSLNPYFVFQVNWVNELFYAFLKENKLIELSTLENNLEMINYEFIGYVKDARNRADRRRLNYLVVLYLNELIFGINQNAPVNIIEWRFNVSRRLSKYSYTTAFNKLKDEVSKVAYYPHIAESSKSLLDKICQRISPKELILGIDWDAPWVYSVLIRAGREVTCAIIDSSPLLLRHDEDRILAIELMFAINSFSQSFWDYIQEYSDLLKTFFKEPLSFSKVWNKELAKKFTPVVGNEAFIYLITRNAVNPFEIEVFKGFNLSAEENSAIVKNFVEKYMSNSLVFVEIIRELISIGIRLNELRPSSAKK